MATVGLVERGLEPPQKAHGLLASGAPRQSMDDCTMQRTASHSEK